MTPAADIAWTVAKKRSPSRAPYTDDELKELRIAYTPNGTPSSEAVVIWTLLDMKYDRDHWRLAKLQAAANTMSPEEWPEIDAAFRAEVHKRAGIPFRENNSQVKE